MNFGGGDDARTNPRGQVERFSTGQQNTTPATAKFDNVTLGPVVGEPDPCETLSDTLNTPWGHADIGTVSKPGGAQEQDGSYKLCGYGGGYADTGDAQSGDVSLTAQVVGLSTDLAGSRAGIFVRRSLEPDADYVSLLTDGAALPVLSSRGGTPAAPEPSPRLGDGTSVGSLFGTIAGSSAGLAAAQNSGSVADLFGGVITPQWLRLTRTGRIVTAYSSTDGTNWQEVGSVVIGLDEEVQVGLAVAAQGETGPALARFRDVSVSAVEPTAKQVAVNGSAPCSLKATGGDLRTHLSLTEEGSPLTPALELGDITFGNVQVRSADAGDVLSQATLTATSVLPSGDANGGASIVILMDESGSIKSFDPSGVRITAAKELVSNLRPGDEAAALLFGNGPTAVLQGFTGDQTLLNAALDKAKVRSSGSDVYSSLMYAVTQLGNAKNALKAVVLITDGEAVGDEINFSEAVAKTRAAGVKVFPVGIKGSGAADAFKFLNRTACETDGVFGEATQAGAIGGIFAALTERLLSGGLNLVTNLKPGSALPGQGRSC